MIEERFESYVYQIMQYVQYQENKPYIESILEEMRYTLFREDRNYIKQLEEENKQLKEEKRKILNYINKRMIHEGEYYFRKAKHFKNTEFGKDLLKLLGDEENE